MTRRGFTPYKLISAATTNATSVAAPQYGSKLLGYEIGNTSASARFVKLYNKASAPTVGTDVPVLTIEVPPTSRAALVFPDYCFFPLGLGLAITGAAADTDATAVGVGDVVLNLFVGS